MTRIAPLASAIRPSTAVTAAKSVAGPRAGSTPRLSPPARRQAEQRRERARFRAEQGVDVGRVVQLAQVVGERSQHDVERCGPVQRPAGPRQHQVARRPAGPATTTSSKVVLPIPASPTTLATRPLRSATARRARASRWPA